MLDFKEREHREFNTHHEGSLTIYHDPKHELKAIKAITERRKSEESVTIKSQK